MTGVLLLNKPKDFTSHDVVAKMRGILHTRKIGHAGTLDPMATGVLPLFIGGATKAVDMMPDQSKRYLATFRLGITTDTQDITGTILEERPVGVSRAEVAQALERFRGDILQIPPMYSAVKIGGKRLYELARAGKEIERQARPVTIYSLELLGGAGETYQLTVHCSKGTYVRTLVHDIGEALGTGATLTELVRTQAGAYSLADCLTLAEAEEHMQAGEIEKDILPVESVFANLPKFTMTAKQATHFFNGVRMSLGQFPLEADNALLRIYGPQEQFIGIALADKNKEMLLQQTLFLQEVSW